jgi:cold shock CspA family protein
MPKGKVKEFSPEHGCGVIIDDDTNQPIAFYANYVLLNAGERLAAGQAVEYEIENNRHRHDAINIKILKIF